MAHNSNLLLASLSRSDTAALQSQLKSVHLEQQRILVEAGAAIEAVYFPTSAVISIVVSLSTGELVEAAMIGRDGVIGAGAALDGKISLSRAIVQLAGDAWMTCSLDDLRSAAMQSQSLLSKLIRHEQTVTAQSQQSAACIASHHIEARLCRWLVEGFVRQRYAAFHAGIPCRDVGRAKDQRFGCRPYPATSGDDQIHPGAKSRSSILRAYRRLPANATHQIAPARSKAYINFVAPSERYVG